MAIPVWLPIVLSSVSLFISLCSFGWQVHRASFTQSIDLLLKLEADFFGEGKKQQRVKAAKELLEGKTFEAENILDFFETVAFLLRRGALDKEIVWHTFYPWLNHYYAATQEMIAARQIKNPKIWKDFSNMVLEMRKFESKLLKQPVPAPTPDAIEAFLKEELTEAA